MDVAAEDLLGSLMSALRQMLAPEVAGAYLFGSAVLGGLRPHSDIDVFVVCNRRTTRDEKQKLIEHLLDLSLKPRPIEMTIVVQSEVRPWVYPPRMDFQYGDWWRGRFEQSELEPWPSATNPDLASLITMVLLANRPLLGPPPALLLDPVPRADFIDAVASRGLPGLLADLDTDTRNVILTLARVWNTLVTGAVMPKDAAAEWALPRLPDEHHEVLRRARAVYLGEEAERWDDARNLVRPYANHVVGEIERSRRQLTASAM